MVFPVSLIFFSVGFTHLVSPHAIGRYMAAVHTDKKLFQACSSFPKVSSLPQSFYQFHCGKFFLNLFLKDTKKCYYPKDHGILGLLSVFSHLSTILELPTVTNCFYLCKPSFTSIFMLQTSNYGTHILEYFFTCTLEIQYAKYIFFTSRQMQRVKNTILYYRFRYSWDENNITWYCS